MYLQPRSPSTEQLVRGSLAASPEKPFRPERRGSRPEVDRKGEGSGPEVGCARQDLTYTCKKVHPG